MSPIRNIFRLCLTIILPLQLSAQKEAPIMLANPSFEDVAHIGIVGGSGPSGWYDCPSKAGESAPDVQPGFWKVTRPPSNGTTYLGLVVRDRESWEGIGQRLSKPLEMNQCYEFSLDLCKSETYMSPTSIYDTKEVPFDTPAKIIIWGGNGYCDKAEVLAQSTIINHTRWIGYNFRLSPKKGNYSFIMIEAYYKTPVLFPYNGHVLVDNASPITNVVCGPEKMPEMPKKPVATVKTPPKTSTATAPKVSATSTPATKTEEKPAVAIGKSAKKNVIYRLEKVYFEANKFELKPESESQLSELLEFLRRRPDVTIEVGGHTNNAMWPNDAFAMELSTSRAKSVASWLISKGIPANRVQFKGYGWTKPILPNTTAEGRKKNQRVEATILSSNG
jgi:outer membrane protein OmpA-like peptidoglycan-associated protein